MEEDGSQSRKSSGATLLSDAPKQAAKQHSQTGLPLCLALCAISATLGSSTQFGYNNGVIAVPSEFVRAFYNNSHFERNNNELDENTHDWLWSSTVSLYCVGALFGAVAGSFFSNRIGRKGALLLSNFISIASYLCFALSKLTNIYELILVGRLIAGFHTGFVNAAVPLYLAEIAPTHLRGFIGLLHPLLLCCGILGAQVIGFYLFEKEHEWPVLLCLPPTLASIFQLVTLPFCPESPRWLYMTKNNISGARRALRRLRNSTDVEEELDQMEEELQKETCGRRLGIGGFLYIVVFRKPHWRLPCLISIVLCTGLQLSGINVLQCSSVIITSSIRSDTLLGNGRDVVWFYIPDICKQAGLSAAQTAVVTVVLGSLNIVGTVFSSIFIDKLGRRPLTIVPSFILSICCIGITLTTKFQTQVPWLQWVCVGFIAVLVLALSGGPGPMVYVIVSEIWPQDPRPAALSLANTFSWTTNFLLSMFFPFLANLMNEYVFLIFGATMFLVGVFYFHYLPETKNKTFEEIAEIFKKENKPSFYFENIVRDMGNYKFETEFSHRKSTRV